MDLPDLISPVMASPFFQALLNTASGNSVIAPPQAAVQANDMIGSLTIWLMGLLPAGAILMIAYHALMKTLAQDEYTAAQHVRSIRNVVIGLVFGLGAAGLVTVLMNFVNPCAATGNAQVNQLCTSPTAATNAPPSVPAPWQPVPGGPKTQWGTDLGCIPGGLDNGRFRIPDCDDPTVNDPPTTQWGTPLGCVPGGMNNGRWRIPDCPPGTTSPPGTSSTGGAPTPSTPASPGSLSGSPPAAGAAPTPPTSPPLVCNARYRAPGCP